MDTSLCPITFRTSEGIWVELHALTMSIIFHFVLPLLNALLLLHSITIVIAFQNHAAVIMKTNQPQTHNSLKDKSHDGDDDDLLRDGDGLHNHNHHRRTPPDASSSSSSLSDIEARLAAINLTLPPPGGPKANYVSCYHYPSVISNFSSITWSNNINAHYAQHALSLFFMYVATCSSWWKSPVSEWPFANETRRDFNYWGMCTCSHYWKRPIYKVKMA